MENRELWNKYKYWISSPIFSIPFAILLFYIADTSKYLSAIIIILGLFIPAFVILCKELILKRNQVQNIRGTEREMKVVINIINTDGDTSFHSRIKITNKDKNPVEFIPRDFYCTPGSEIKLDKPKLIKSSVKDISINERVKLHYDKVIKIDNNDIPHKYVECNYRVSPPLRGINDFIQYDLDIDAKGYALKSFDDSGEIEGFVVKNIARKTEMRLNAPNKYKIELLDYWVEDCQANRIEYLKSTINTPTLTHNDNCIKWVIDYPRMNYLYLFKYKIKKR